MAIIHHAKGCTALRRDVRYCAELCCVARWCALLRCGPSSPCSRNPGRLDQDLKLELPERLARQKMVAVEMRGTLNQLELKIRLSSRTGRTERGRTRTETNRTEKGRTEKRGNETRQTETTRTETGGRPTWVDCTCVDLSAVATE